ncbi:hypothetical protein QR680_008886 [Steinernema hermaphroditum]|uniref:G-protein coupled receptors family 1 profile domain-containing protein n=1 Tax=Steinernema hermaphroditum TaxID=289476 RepID=A0AA39M8Q0_9BILA|nr:hypothetical protein QR680_008886 [Steinernema hermaphroditum]
MEDPFDSVRIFAKPALLLCSLLVSASALMTYSRIHKNNHIMSTLLLFIVACVLHSAVYFIYHFCILLHEKEIHTSPLFSAGFGWLYTLQMIPTFFIFISSYALALDRLLAVSVPLKYMACDVSMRICALTISLMVAVLVTLVLSNVFLPFDDENSRYGMDESSFTYRLITSMNTATDVGLTLEIALHLAFCVLFWRISKSQQRTRERADRVNQIMIVQAISQTIFCWAPLIGMDVNSWFFDDNRMWARLFNRIYVFSYDVNTIILCLTVILRLKPQKTAAPVKTISTVSRTK